MQGCPQKGTILRVGNTVLLFLAFLIPGPLLASEMQSTSASSLQELQTLTNALYATIKNTNAISSTSGATTLMLHAPPSDSALQLEIATKRGVLMKTIAKEDTATFLQNVMPSSIFAQLSPASQAVSEKGVTLDGKTTVTYADDFKNPKNSQLRYFVRANSTTYPLYLAPAPALSSGTEVRITGYQIGEALVADGGPAGVQVLYQPILEATGVQKTLVMLVTAPGMPAGLSPAEIKNIIFSGKFQAFYKEQSYGKISFEGDVTDWITTAYDPNMCFSGSGISITPEHPSIKNYIQTHGIDLSQYGRIVMLINGLNYGCSFVGKSDVIIDGKNYRFSLTRTAPPPLNEVPYKNMSIFDYTLSHEMGHALGVWEANAWDCSGPSLDINCQHFEFGNTYDVMGFASNGRHFNAFYKDLLGWIDPSSKVNITADGTYSLAPYEGNSGVRTAVITNPATPSALPFYVEFRQPLGFDSILPTSSAGLFFNQVVHAND